jgi:hypothetical protein
LEGIKNPQKKDAKKGENSAGMMWENRQIRHKFNWASVFGND